MLLKSLPKYFIRTTRNNPVFKILDLKATSKPEAVDYLRANIESIRSPFVIVDLRKLKDRPQQVQLVKDSLQELKNSDKKIYVWTKSDFRERLHTGFLATVAKAESKWHFKQKLARLKAWKSRLAFSEATKSRYRQRVSVVKEALRTRGLLKHPGYSTYSRQVDKILPEPTDSLPVEGYLKEMIFQPKKFVKRMMKSKYVYYFLIFKVTGWTIKLALLIYFFYIKPKRAKEVGEESDSTVRAQKSPPELN